MKIAVLGGSFNPIHIGHLALGDEVCSVLGYDKVLFIPTYNPPHKQLNEIISVTDRFNMVKLACDTDERFEAEDCEINRQGVSYTYDTICYLEQKYAGKLEDKIGLIMGDDLLAGFHLWYKAEEIAQRCQLILGNRPKTIDDPLHKNQPKGRFGQVNSDVFDRSSESLFKSAVYIDNPSLRVSSTDIRFRVVNGRPFKYLVPPEVFKYIKDKGLYGFNK